MTERFAVNPVEMILLHRCLSSRVCIRIFRVLREAGALNISAIARKANCTNNDAKRHLEKQVRLGIVRERFYAGRHTYTIQNNRLTELMVRALDAMDAGA